MTIQVHPPFQLPLDFKSSEYKDVSICPGLHPVHSAFHLPWISVYKGKVEIA